MTDVELGRRIRSVLGSEPIDVVELEGGMIGSVQRVDLADGRRVVAKTGETPLDVEAFMLRYLRTASALPVPDVYDADADFLLLEFVDGSTDHSPSVAVDVADHLATLHDREGPAFGFERDTLTGPVRQPNPWTDSWIEFYRDHRVRHVAELAIDGGSLPRSIGTRIGRLCDDLDDLLEEPESPALVHGDVWRTNVLSRDGRVTAFIDPATYYAHPEIELAYVDWTDAFGDPFFDRYRERRGIGDGFFERRRFAYRLYPLVVHVHLFGGRYVDELAETIDRLDY